MKAGFIKKLLRPPRYLSMKAAGINISDRFVRYIEFIEKKGHLSIKNFGEIPLPANTMKEGEILNANALVKALSEVRTKITSDFVKISVPEEKTYVFDTEVPLVKGSSIRESIAFKLEENVPLKIDEVFFEYDMVKKEEESGTHNAIFSISVIPKKVIEDFTAVSIRAGLTNIGFEIESRMVARSVIARDDRRNLLVIHIKEDSTLLSLVASGVVRFTSTVAIGESSMKENLAKAAPVLSSGKIPDTFFYPHATDNDPSDSLINIFSAIRDEIEKFNDYLSSTSEKKGIPLPQSVDEIIISGRSAALSGLIRHVSQGIEAPVTLANVWTNVFDINDELPRLTFVDSLDFPVAIGLAL